MIRSRKIFGAKEKASFEVHKCMKEAICIWCGKPILKGVQYYSKPENSKMIAKFLEEETGWDIYTIKSRTHFYFCDRVSWKFCSLECLGNFSKYTWEALPFNVRGRMGPTIARIVAKIKDVIKLMTLLEGQEKHDYSDNESL